MSNIGYIRHTMPKIEKARIKIQTIVAPKTIGDKKQASQEDGSSNKAKKKTNNTIRKHKAKLKKVVIEVNPYRKKFVSKIKVGLN